MINARTIVQQLGGRWAARGAVVRCPAHEDRSPSLSVKETRDGRPLVHCHAGCSQTQVIEALKARGLWAGAAVVDPSYPGQLTTAHDGHRDRDDRAMQQFARDLWDRANPIKGTLAAAYLNGRGINAPIWPDALGYMPRLEHKPSGRSFPAMIGALTDNRDQVVAVQRTWLAKDGNGKAPVTPAKMTCGPMGCAAVRLGPAAAIIGLAEGIETALSAKQLYQIPVWATLSANRLDKIALPAVVESIVIFADHGDVGMRAAIAAAEVYEAQGRAVDVMPPRVHFGEQAKDFNDVVRADA